MAGCLAARATRREPTSLNFSAAAACLSPGFLSGCHFIASLRYAAAGHGARAQNGARQSVAAAAAGGLQPRRPCTGASAHAGGEQRRPAPFFSASSVASRSTPRICTQGRGSTSERYGGGGRGGGGGGANDPQRLCSAAGDAISVRASKPDSNRDPWLLGWPLYCRFARLLCRGSWRRLTSCREFMRDVRLSIKVRQGAPGPPRDGQDEGSGRFEKDLEEAGPSNLGR